MPDTKAYNYVLISNYVIRRIQSKLISILDYDCVIEGDYISHAINTDDFTLHYPSTSFPWYNFCINPVVLRFIRGYNEKYENLEMAQRDMYNRLVELGVKVVNDFRLTISYLFDVPDDKIYDNKKSIRPIANVGDDWGKGFLDPPPEEE
jgi:hypothetical protein